MTEFVPLDQLLIRGRRDEHPVAFRNGEQLAFSELAARVGAWHAAFADRPGTRWGLFFEDSFDFAAALLGALHAGRVAVLAPDTRPATREKLRTLVDGFAGDFPVEDAPLRPVAAGTRTLQPIPPRAPALVLFTSGSTGEPLAIPKRLDQLTAEIQGHASRWDPVLGEDRVLSTVSHQHIYGLLHRVLWPLCSGRPFAAQTLAYPEDLVAALHEAPATLVASPAHLKRLPEQLDWSGVRGRLRAVFTSGGPLPTEALPACRRLLGQAPVEVYGSSETGGVAWRQRSEDDAAPWLPLPGVETRAPDGVLEVRSPFLEGPDWLRTADRVRPAEEGFELLGREDRVVKLEEKRVSLTALEQALLAGDLVREVRVVLLPGVRTVLGVVAVPSPEGWQLHDAEGKRGLNAKLRAQLAAGFETSVTPRRFRYLEAMPANSQGKTPEAALIALFDPRRPEARLTERSPTRAVLELEADAGSPFFDGHFPKRPILPGVAQLAWVVLLAREHFPLPADFLGMEGIKFHQVIVPGQRLTLELGWEVATGRLSFRIDSERGAHASGRLHYGGAQG